jgi:DNA-binding MarR family transcriptional regulator
MDETTVTAALKPLARRRLVEIRPDPGDARTKRLFLTAAGIALLERAVPIWRATHEGMERSIGSRDHRERFRNDLEAVGLGRNV